MPLLNNVEYNELLGGLESLRIRAPVALGSAVLLVLAGDLAGLWPLCWVALVPLCFACRGAGAVGALLLAGGCFTLAAVAQSFWLLDVEDASPVAIWVTAGVLPAIPLAAIELPITRKIPWALRPPLLVLLAIGFWALFPPNARMLIPCGGLIDSGLVSWLLAKIDLATVAACMLGLGWLAAEMFATPRQAVERRAGLAGLGLAGLLALAGLVDFVGVAMALDSVGVGQVAPVVVVPAGDDLTAQSDRLLPERASTGVVVWRALAADPTERAEWASRAGELAERRQVVVALVVVSGDGTWGYLFVQQGGPTVAKLWATGEVPQPVVYDGLGQISLYPALEGEPHWATRWSLELYISPREPAHTAHARWWLREQRRGALIRGSRQVVVWQGGGAAIDGRGRIIAHSLDGQAFVAQLPAADSKGEPMGHPRQKVVETILEFSAPVLVLMLALLTPVAWAKRRWWARQRAAIGIEEIPDDTSTLSKEETEKMTRSFKRDQ